MIDVITTVKELVDRGVQNRSLSDAIDPSTRDGRPIVSLMATLTEHARELIPDRVQDGVNAVKKHGGGTDTRRSIRSRSPGSFAPSSS